MTHSKDIAGLVEAIDKIEECRKKAFYDGLLDKAWGLNAALEIIRALAALRPAADPKAEGPWPPIEQAIEIGPEPVVEWEDPRVQAVYEILCRDFRPPNEGEHREGYQARLIVDALAHPTPDAERAGEPGQPVAWRVRFNLSVDDDWVVTSREPPPGNVEAGYAQPLYTSQSPPRG